LTIVAYTPKSSKKPVITAQPLFFSVSGAISNKENTTTPITRDIKQGFLSGLRTVSSGISSV
tara:strand:+ start:835 stop:1020 length:186 start_codon:yes stop_codon:yes gene_type:complete